ncbi:hypothetical protein GEOBRER4_n1623 [Citrifermentans bremense]|uniref:DNA-directed RNA polymerase n=1 Tax=Citrifermentans bremense TaxID=60035 RepID=A0A6S6M4B5_9BACT|nr:hypothetical protein [Citrifermentans bremense]BCG46786.1 hypothetical protein GEOBRER4_n1598 [Citrifermentans bremense]BCG46809.1 hypothetical protein GEOBRER4_n1623 [Citrifermentans bremense]
MTPEELDNSIPLNTSEFWYRVDAPEIISTIWTVVYGADKYRPDSKQANHIRLLLSKLYTCHMSGYDCIGYSRYGVSYRLKNPKNVLQLSFRVTTAIIDALYSAGYIEDWRGFTYADKSSRMRANASLIALIEDVQRPIALPLNHRIPDDSLFIKFKDHEKNRIPFVHDEFTLAWNQQLIDYNRLLARSSLSLSCPIPERVNFDRRIVTRTFNDESLRLGGRFYGGWWLRIESNYRKHILINGEPTVEIDYKGIHVFLAYLMEGIDCFKLFDGDPYVIDAPDLGMEWRKVTKAVTLKCLNAKSRKEAAASINSDMNLKEKEGKKNKKKIKRHPKYKPSQLVDMCIEKHPLINHYFNSDCGKMLQFYDSHIASQVIQHFLVSEIPILPVHDSFICQRRHADKLDQVMKNVVETSYGLEPITKWNMVCEQSEDVE